MKVFWAFTRQAFHNTVIYRFEFWLRLFSIYLTMYGIYWVWKVLFTHRPGAFNVTYPQMVTYGLLGMTLELFLEVGPEFYIAQQIRTGAIDTDLMKPLDFHLHMLARSSGEMFFNLAVLTVPAFLCGTLLFDMQFPAGLHAGLLFCISIVFSFLVYFHISFLIGMLSIITLDIRSISWAYYSLIGFFSGQMLPLWLLPSFLQKLADALPFKSIYFIPMSIYIGTFNTGEAIKGIAFQFCWALALIFISRWVWNNVQNRLISQGG